MEASGGHLEDIWRTSGGHLEDIWRHLEDIWRTSEQGKTRSQQLIGYNHPGSRQSGMLLDRGIRGIRGTDTT